MKPQQIILFPLGLVWGIIAQIKRTLYELLNLRSVGSLPNIVVGNINVGGTGKTPTIIWLYNQLLTLGISSEKMGVLSRGYKRQTKGFTWVNFNSTPDEVGDEPLEILSAVTLQPSSNPMRVAVCENRVVGINRMRQQSNPLSLVLLDDGFQHLRLKHDLGFLLCDYQKPFTKDWPLPTGRLREFPWASNSASALIVTNCPKDLSHQQAEAFQLNLKKQMNRWMWLPRLLSPDKSVKWEKSIAFFCSATSTPSSANGQAFLSSDSPVYLITGIANPHRVSNNMNGYQIVQHDKFGDHHIFSKTDINRIILTFNNLHKKHPALAVITTRKDYVKLQSIWPNNLPLFLVASHLEPLFDSDKKITQLIKNFIHEHKIA